MQEDKLIVLDCDGVLLNYHHTFGQIYTETFNQELSVNNPKAYLANDYWGIKWENQNKELFYKAFSERGWKSMPALDGAIEATHLLRQAGYKILVVTSIPEYAKDPRHQNLMDLGFAVDATIAAGEKVDAQNPKKSFIETLNPLYFVDDLVDNFHYIENESKFVFINRDYENLPYSHPYDKPLTIHHEHSDLLDFVHNVILLK